MSYCRIHEAMQLLKLQYSLPQDTEVVNNINRLEKDGDRFMEKTPTLVLNMMTLYVISISGTLKPFSTGLSQRGCIRSCHCGLTQYQHTCWVSMKGAHILTWKIDFFFFFSSSFIVVEYKRLNRLNVLFSVVGSLHSSWKAFARWLIA